MRQLKAKLTIHPPVNVHILVRASSGQGRAHDREIHVGGWHRWMRSRAILSLRSPVICSLSAVAIRARGSTPRFAQAIHLLLGGWGRRAGEQLLKAATSAETADSPAFLLVNRLVSAPGRIRTRDRLLRRHRQASAVVLAGRPA